MTVQMLGQRCIALCFKERGMLHDDQDVSAFHPGLIPAT